MMKYKNNDQSKFEGTSQNQVKAFEIRAGWEIKSAGAHLDRANVHREWGWRVSLWPPGNVPLQGWGNEYLQENVPPSRHR